MSALAAGQVTAADPAPVLVAAFGTAALLLGGPVTAPAGRAAARTGDPGLGALPSGVADRALALPASQALVVESALTAPGFLVVGYSLSVGQPAQGWAPPTVAATCRPRHTRRPRTGPVGRRFPRARRPVTAGP